jgi:D-arabinan exo alpha-(1,3)/(1,5)-arabinofuranosidase (non-reducing end)
MKSLIRLNLLVGLVLIVFTMGVVATTDETVMPGIDELYRLDCLGMLKQSTKVASISSYDRTGGNNDGFGGQYSFVRKEEGGLVLADLKGPGVIYRIWTPTPTDDVMEFYFDGEDQPRITVKFRELFMGNHATFPRPLVGYGAGGFYSYVPLRYEKSCKVFIRTEKIQFYQINYATYPQEIGIKTFSVNPDSTEIQKIEKAKTLFSLAGQDISAYVVPDNGAIKKLFSMVTLQPGKETIVFEAGQPGRIVGIRMNPVNAFIGKNRDITIRAYWDNDDKPAINCPVADFFGYAWGEPATKSLLIGTADNTNYCYFPMPYDKSARIELVAEPGMNQEISVEAEIIYTHIARKKNEAKFYALWRRENPTTKGKPFTFIDTKGQGHIVGVIQQSQGFKSGVTPFFEGDDQTTIDGELVIHGTGSEDFYNGGWYDVPGRWETKRSFPLSGCLGYKKHLGRTGGYRIMLGDAYAYNNNILQTIEHAPTNNDILNDYCGVTYLYSMERPTCDFELAPVDERKVIDPKKIIFAVWWNTPIYSFSLRNATLKKESGRDINNKDIRYLSMKTNGKATFGPHSISFNCDIPASGTYKISLDVVKGPDQGIIQMFVDEASAGPELDLYDAEIQAAPGKYVSTLQLEQGSNILMFKLIGKNEKSEGLGLKLTNIICEKVE